MTRPLPWRQWSALFAGAAAWAGSSQVGYRFAPLSGASRAPLVPAVTAAAILLVAAGLWFSWSGLRLAIRDRRTTLKFVAVISLGVGLLFLLTILLQGASVFVFSGCER